MYTLTTSYQR